MLLSEVRRDTPEIDGESLFKMHSPRSLLKALSFKALDFGLTHKFLTFVLINVIGLSIWLPFFLFYHIHNLINNKTTNEKQKLSKLEYGLNNQLIFLQSLRHKTIMDTGCIQRIRIDGVELSCNKENRVK